MPYKTWATGEVATASALNANLRDQVISTVSSTSLVTSPQTGQVIFNTTTNRHQRYNGSSWVELGTLAMLNAGNALYGSTPTLPDTCFKVQAASKVGTTDASGLLAVNFEEAFSTGTLLVVATSGDYTTGWIEGLVGSTTSGFTVRVRNPGATTVANTVSVRVNYIALGW